MDYVEVQKTISTAVRQYLSSTHFSWTELPEWHGKNGQMRARIVLEALSDCNDVRVLLLLYAMMHMQSTKLKNTIAQHIVNTGVLGPTTSEVMQKNRVDGDLNSRQVKTVLELCAKILGKLQRPTDVEIYSRLLFVLNRPYGRSSRDVLGHLQELVDHVMVWV